MMLDIDENDDTIDDVVTSSQTPVTARSVTVAPNVDSTAGPETPRTVTAAPRVNSAHGSACSFYDFVPKPPTGSKKSLLCSDFSTVMEPANKLLAQHPELEVVNCESVSIKLPSKKGKCDREMTSYVVEGKTPTHFLRILRVWCRPRTSQDGAGPTQIAYSAFTPRLIKDDATEPEFASFSETLKEINKTHKSQPLPGRIINVETVEVRFKSWENVADADECTWSTNPDEETSFLNTIRIFYKQGSPAMEVIGSVDFVPDMIRGVKPFKNGPATSFHNFGSVIQQVNNWVKGHPESHIVARQSLDHMIHQNWNGAPLATDRSCFSESRNYSTYYVRFLRMVYVTGADRKSLSTSAMLSYRTFEPEITMSAHPDKVHMGKYENMSKTMARIDKWLDVTDAKVAAAECIHYIINLEKPNFTLKSEETFTRDFGQKPRFFFTCIRLYFDAAYTEPAEDALPARPQVADPSACCAIL